MGKFDPDPNRPGWGTYTNDTGQAAYDYFPNLAGPSQSQFPSASASVPEVNASVAPPMMSAAPAPAAPETAAPNASHGTASGLLASLEGTKAKLGTGAPAGAPAVKPGGLAVASTSTSTVQGRPAAAIARDKAALSATNDATQAANTEVGQARRERAETTARGEQGTALSQSLTAAGELSTNLAEQAETRRKLSETLAEKDPEVQPKRLVDNMSTGSKVATAIIAALTGGFGAIAGIRENPALAALNGAIDEDLANQREQIAAGRVRRGNLIQAYRERGMDLRQAETAARATITEAIRRHAAAQAAELGAAAHTEDAQLLNQGLEAQYQSQVQALDASGESRTQTTVERRPLAPKADAESLLKQLQVQNATLDQLDAQEVGSVVGRNMSPDQARELKRDAKEYAKQRATNANSRRAVQRVADEVGLVLQDGQYVPGPNGVDVDVLPTEKKRRVERAYAGLKEAQVMRMAREPSARLQDEFGSVLDRPFYDDEIAGQLNEVMLALDAADDNLRTGYGESAKLFEARSGGPTPSLRPR